jgi:ADP-ribose 1''-phosphate phosphatase
MIKYVKGSLFDAPRGSILVHAVNAQGVWGSGIAVEFKKRFPEAYKNYKFMCEAAPLTGVALLTAEENGYQIGCLFTSFNYGDRKDSKGTILRNTKNAIPDFLFLCGDKPIWSNKFNSGLFGVPWEETEKVLAAVIGEKEWNVCEL